MDASSTERQSTGTVSLLDDGPQRSTSEKREEDRAPIPAERHKEGEFLLKEHVLRGLAVTCMTSMMRTNQERNHPSRFLHEVSGGATCDQECQRQHSDRAIQESIVSSISHYQQIVKYAKEGRLGAVTMSVRRLKLDMQIVCVEVYLQLVGNHSLKDLGQIG